MINAPENSAGNKCIQEAKLNGKEYTNNFLSHADLMKGAVLDLKMGVTSNMKRETNENDSPYSFSREK